MNRFTIQARHVKQKLLQGNWEHMQIDTSYLTTNLAKWKVSYSRRYIKSIGGILQDLGINFIVAGGYPSWLLGLKYSFGDINIFIQATDHQEMINYLDNISDKILLPFTIDRIDVNALYKKETHINKMSVMHIDVIRNSSNIQTFPGGQIQIHCVVPKRKNLSHSEFTHKILWHFPLPHVRIAMSYFSSDYTSCKMYRLDSSLGHYKQAQMLKTFLLQYFYKYYTLTAFRLRPRSSSITYRTHYHRFSILHNILTWTERHAEATSKQKRIVKIKYNLRLTSLCLQVINRNTLKRYGNNGICNAAKQLYIA
jgi:hypothetical protein